jgi:aspartyl-tRNA(Asn)/glutamyl-tRNA(Gln) amidotransferase subunit C
MKISKDDVVRVAELAHLQLSEAEVETYRAQLDSILSYIGKLNELDTAQVEPMAGGRPAGVGGDADPLRADVPRPSNVIAEVMRIAPDPSPDQRYIRVPKVIER